MPFKSRAQVKFMFARHPEIAKRWVEEKAVPKDLPEHVRRQGRGTQNKVPDTR